MSLRSTGLQSQVSFDGSILRQTNIDAEPVGLFVVWRGGNDLRDLIFSLPATVDEAVQAMESAT